MPKCNAKVCLHICIIIDVVTQHAGNASYCELAFILCTLSFNV